MDEIRKLMRQIDAAQRALACAEQEVRLSEAVPEDDDEWLSPCRTLAVDGWIRRTLELRREDEAVGRLPGHAGHQYLLLDCAVQEGAFARFARLFPDLPWRPLYADVQPPQADAPRLILIEIPNGELPDILVSWFVSTERAGRGMTHIDSALELDELAQRLRERMVVAVDDGRLALLPFHDPRILLGLPRALTDAQCRHFFAPVARWNAFDHARGQHFTIVVPRDAAEDPRYAALPMLLGAAQLKVLSAYDDEERHAALIGDWQRYYPDHLDQIETHMLREVAIAAVSRCTAFGITDRESQRLFGHLMFELSPSFDEHPAVRAILAAPDIAPCQRVTDVIHGLPDEAWQEIGAQRRYDALFERAAPAGQPVLAALAQDHGETGIAALLRELGPPTRRVPVPAAAIARWRGRLPDQLLAYWESQGWSAWADGLFWIVDPDAWAGALDAWIAQTPLAQRDSFHVIARSAFGHLFLWGERSGASVTIAAHDNSIHTLVRYVERALPDPDAQVRACFAMPARQRCDIVDEEGEPLFERALAALGPLEPGELYGFEPALCLGGSRRLARLARLDGCVHLAILSQLGGVGMPQPSTALQELHGGADEDAEVAYWNRRLRERLDATPSD